MVAYRRHSLVITTSKKTKRKQRDVKMSTNAKAFDSLLRKGYGTELPKRLRKKYKAKLQRHLSKIHKGR